MFNLFQMEFSLLATSIVLMIMAGAALFFGFLLHAKSRALRILPKDLSVKVFDRTFNVFDPHIKQRRVISGHTGLVVFIAIYGSWLAFIYIVFKSFELGGVLGAIAFVICAALLMIDETQELSKNAGIFAKAIRDRVGLAKGDIEVLHIIRKTLPKLSVYHLTLAVVFFVSALTVPILVDAVFLASAGIAAALFAVTAATFKVLPTYIFAVMGGVFAAGLVTAQVAVKKIRKRIFGFPSPVPLEKSDLGLQMERIWMYGRKINHHPMLREPMPEDTEKMCRKDLEEHQKG